jgi:hypothetical protein
MRSISYGVLLCLSLGVSVSFLACGSDVVDQNPTGAGGSTSASTTASGTGGDNTSATATSATTTTTTTAATTSTSSGGNTCDQACAKLDTECGFGDVCALAGDYLDCTNAQSECPSQCILDADCTQLATIFNPQNIDPALGACIGACGGMGAGGAGGGGGGNCSLCLLQNCGGDVQTCQGDAECQAWLGCAQGCNNDGACINACSASYPNAAPLFLPIYDCACQSCPSDCSAIDPCNPPMGGSGAGGAGGAGGQGGG